MPASTLTKLFSSRIDLSEETRSKLVDLLNQALANALDLKTQVKYAHWNVKGIDFYQLHLLFDEMAEELEAQIDLLAERATALGGIALGTLRIAAKHSQLSEYNLDAVSSTQHVNALIDKYAMYAKFIRECVDQADDLDDDGTEDLFTQISRDADKRLWFLEAHIQGK